MDSLLYALITGVGATVVMDLWGIVRQALLRVPAPNYGLVGRWLHGLAHGRFRHVATAISPPVRAERWIGWSAHYLLGIGFAALLLGACGLSWIREPTLAPAVLLGIGTVAVPFLVMQPLMGAGIAASRTPHPAAARLQSLITHGVFGLGLYASGWVASLLQ